MTLPLPGTTYVVSGLRWTVTRAEPCAVFGAMVWLVSECGHRMGWPAEVVERW